MAHFARMSAVSLPGKPMWDLIHARVGAVSGLAARRMSSQAWVRQGASVGAYRAAWSPMHMVGQLVGGRERRRERADQRAKNSVRKGEQGGRGAARRTVLGHEGWEKIQA